MNTIYTSNFSSRARLLALVGGLATAVAALSADQVQAWEPTGTVEIIVSSAAGGGQDLTARSIARFLQETEGLTTVVKNMPGGGGALAWSYLNQHEGDGHYIAISSGRLLTSYIEGVTEVGYMHVTPLAQVLTEFAFVSVAANSPITNADDMMTKLREDPQSLSIYNGGGLGSPSHIGVAKLAKAGGIDPTKLRLVSFESGGEAMAALLGGHIDVHTATGASVAPRHQEGVIRVLGVAAPERVGGLLADVPTFKEQGYDVVAERSTTIFGPKGMSDEQIAYWDRILKKMVESQTWASGAAKDFRENTYMDQAATVKYLDEAHEDLTDLMTELDLIQK